MCVSASKCVRECVPAFLWLSIVFVGKGLDYDPPPPSLSVPLDLNSHSGLKVFIAVCVSDREYVRVFTCVCVYVCSMLTLFFLLGRVKEL